MAIEEHVALTPNWLKALVDDVVLPAFSPFEYELPLGFRYKRPAAESEPWEVLIFPPPILLVNQPDSEEDSPATLGFSLDVAKIIDGLNHVDGVAWRAPVKYNNNLDCPEVSVQGRFAGYRVRVRFFHAPPPDEPAVLSLDVQTNEVRKLSPD